MRESSLPRSIALCAVAALVAGLTPPVPATDPNRTARDAVIGEPHTVTASVDSSTDVSAAEQVALRPGVFTIPRGYTAGKLAYRWTDPATGAQSNRLTATTVYSFSKRRYMTELKDDRDAVLPAGDYRLVVGGVSGASAQLTYSLDYADGQDDSEAAAIKRLWYGVVDFRNACVENGDDGWKQFADPLVLQHLDEINQRT